MKPRSNEFDLKLAQLTSKAQFSLMSCIDKWGQYQCLQSNDLVYEMGKTYSIYQFPALLRILGRKADLFTSALQEELYRDDEALVAIINWQGLKRDFIHLKFSILDEDFIVDFVASYKEEFANYTENLRAENNFGSRDCL